MTTHSGGVQCLLPLLCAPALTQLTLHATSARAPEALHPVTVARGLHHMHGLRELHIDTSAADVMPASGDSGTAARSLLGARLSLPALETLTVTSTCMMSLAVFAAPIVAAAHASVSRVSITHACTFTATAAGTHRHGTDDRHSAGSKAAPAGDSGGCVDAWRGVWQALARCHSLHDLRVSCHRVEMDAAGAESLYGGLLRMASLKELLLCFHGVRLLALSDVVVNLPHLRTLKLHQSFYATPTWSNGALDDGLADRRSHAHGADVLRFCRAMPHLCVLPCVH